jgi:hypothetical protein
MIVKLKYTAEEALKIVQEFFPNQYRMRIDKQKMELLRIQRLHKKTMEEAYKFYCEKTSDRENRLFILIAAQELSNESNPVWISSQIKTLNEEINRAVEQLTCLESFKSLNSEEKSTLRQFYQNLLVKNEQRLRELASTIEVVDAAIILPNPTLFGQYTQSN